MVLFEQLFVAVLATALLSCWKFYKVGCSRDIYGFSAEIYTLSQFRFRLFMALYCVVIFL